MASLALGIAGAFAGSAFGPLGASIGWTLGAALGNMLDPQKIQGPRLDDLKLHNSSYGQITPRLWGTMRLAGNIIDEQPELTEHSETSGGGKGGPEVTNYTYTCSFAVRLCEGPVLGIRKIWANGRLIWDRSSTSTIESNDLPITVYRGSEEQLPDPTLESIHGVGNVPAYRGVAYVVFSDLLLTEYGNALPNLNFEVYTTASEIPERISFFTAAPEESPGWIYGVAYNAETGIITVGEWSPGGHPTYAEQQWTTDGTSVSSLPEQPISNFGELKCTISNLNIAAIGIFGTGDTAWYRNGEFLTFLTADGDVYGTGVYQGGFLYVAHGPTTPGIQRYSAPDGIPVGAPDIRINLPGASADSIRFGTSDNGKLYVRDGSTGLYEYSAELELEHHWDNADFPAGLNVSNLKGNFVRYNDFFAFSFAGLGFDSMNLISVASDHTLSLYPQQRGGGDIPVYVFESDNVVPLAGGLVLGSDGVTNLAPTPGGVPLSEIVGDISELCGLDGAEYDVSELTDIVDGYSVSQQAAGREWIQPLRDAWFFDAVERDEQVVFVKRGKASAVAIQEDDLSARGDGETAPPIVGIVRAQEVDLPAIVNVSHIDAAADYQTGTQSARRQVTLSQSEVSLTLPINMTSAKAKSVADTQLYMAWIERDRYTLFTSRKYAKFEPTDVVTHGRNIRIVDKSETRSGVLKFDGVASLSQIFAQAGGAVTRLEFTSSPPTVVVVGDTTVYLLDIPLVSDGDDPDGFYAAASGGDGWPGYTLMKSIDGGASYSAAASTAVASVVGTALDTLGDFTGGNTFDEADVVTVLTTGGGELASATELAVLNGANEAVIGDEVIQFKSAELVDVNTYELSGLLRGRLGTEWAIGSHVSGERFVLLPALRVPSEFSELYVARSYKPVTFGKTLASAGAQEFTNTGAAYRCYAPVLLGGGTDGAGNVALNWTRRTRTGGAWLPFADVPLSEIAESYAVEIWNADFSLCARTIFVSGTTSTVYDAADQVSDFGAEQQTIYFTVAQFGSVSLGTRGRGTATGAGATNDDPIAPIDPVPN